MKQYIDDIFCYCDHWCARCPFTARCAVFAGLQLQPGADPASPEFWEAALAHFAATQPGLAECVSFAVEVRTPAAEELELARQRQERIDAHLDAEPLMQQVGSWQAQLLSLMEDTPYWQRLAQAAASEAALGLRSAREAMREAERVTGCLHALRRWAGVAADRLAAALVRDIDDAEALAAGAPEGLAKAALVCLDGSREALAELYGIFADEDRLLPLFTTLATLERSVNEYFPAARAFVRPGFDEAGCLRAAG
ncbi:MAG: hypothetical protein EOO16_09600 [Chitinophagaceae bacterium]|nr:MAG: hypothetical protein EOO16_09600 [Chitinophagaceae bacterium]